MLIYSLGREPFASFGTSVLCLWTKATTKDYVVKALVGHDTSHLATFGSEADAGNPNFGYEKIRKKMCRFPEVCKNLMKALIISFFHQW